MLTEEVIDASIVWLSAAHSSAGSIRCRVALNEAAPALSLSRNKSLRICRIFR